MFTFVEVIPSASSSVPVPATAINTATTTAAALELLHQGTAHLMSASGWRAALALKAFHPYSFFNVSLILSQRPDATLVAGYKRWQELGRCVREGEEGIAILAPLFRNDPDDPDGQVLCGYKRVYVYDVSQTEGEPVAAPATSRRLEGDGEAVQRALIVLEAFAVGEGFTVEHELELGQTLGAYWPTTGKISLHAVLSPLQRLKTFVCMMAHALLHDPTDSARTKLEAESCAFLVCYRLGLDTSEYRFSYLARWPNDGSEIILAAGDRASKTAERICATVVTAAELVFE